MHALSSLTTPARRFDVPRRATRARLAQKAEGFSAIEAHIGTWRRDKAAFSSALEAAGLQLIAQVHTTAVLEPNFAGYRYMTSR